MDHYLARKRPENSAEFFSRTALDVKSCKDCETAGLACEKCKAKSNCSWLRMVMEKARCRHFLATSLMATDLPQEQRLEAVRLLQAARPPEDMSASGLRIEGLVSLNSRVVQRFQNPDKPRWNPNGTLSSTQLTCHLKDFFQ